MLRTLALFLLRDLAMWLATAHGWAYGWLRTGWRLPAIYALGLAEVLWLADRGFRPDPPWFQSSTYLALAGVVGALALVWEARSRLAIDEFTWAEPRAEPKENERSARGLATLLGTKLSHLSRLYEPIDEQRQISTTSGDAGLRATLSVGAPSQVLRDTVSAETKLGLGPLQIPVGAVLSLAARLTQGPRINGTVFVESGTVSILAELLGGGRTLAWRTSSVRLATDAQPIASAALSNGVAPGTLDSLLDELALQIFADLALGGSARWRAVRCYTDGLRLYRESLRTPKDARLNRQRARQMFIESLAEDSTTSLAYYNLGVVYSDLAENAGSGAERDAARAEQAFRVAIERQPGRVEPYYALAAQLYVTQRFVEAIELCRRVITIMPNHPEAHDLMGLAQGRLAGSFPQAAADLPAYGARLPQVAQTRERAVSLAWWALFWARLRGIDPELRTRALAHKTHRNLGVIYARMAETLDGARRSFGFWSAAMLLRRVETFAPGPAALPAEQDNIFASVADLQHNIGNVYTAWRKPLEAAKYYRRACETSPTDALYRARLARALAAAGQFVLARKEAELVPRTTETLADRGYGSVFAELRSAYLNEGPSRDAARLDAMAAALDEIARVRTQGGAALRGARKRYVAAGLSWEAAQCTAALGLFLFDQQDDHGAARVLALAIDALKHVGPDQIRVVVDPSRENSGNLYWYLAEAERRCRQYQPALLANEEARRLSPFAFGPLVQRGEIYRDIEEYRNAADVWVQALLINPDDASVHFKIGAAHWSAARGLRGEARLEVVAKARAYLESARDLYPPEGDDRGWVHEQLGLLNTEAGEYANAIYAFRTAKALGVSPLYSQIYLAQAYIREREFDSAESTARGLIKEAEARLAKEPDLLNGPIPKELGSGLARLLCYAQWLLAYSYAKRGVLAEARKAIAVARSYAAKVTAPDDRRLCEAVCYDCAGFIAYQDLDLDGAETALKNAIRSVADAEAYVHLGMVYVARREDAADASAKRNFGRLASRCLERATELDFTGEFAADRKRLEAEVKA